MTPDNPSLEVKAGTAVERDRAFDLLAHPHRRIVVAELEPGASTSVGDLADRVAARAEALSPRQVEIALVHNHLPRLDEAGVVAYDRVERTLEMTDGASIRPLLDSRLKSA